MSRIYQKGEKILCPHCFEEQEYLVEEYPLPGRVGPASESEEQCLSCDEFFFVVALGDNEFEVRETDEPSEYEDDDEDQDEM